jgi:GNAT superfamily N-acetyltransferase
MELIIREMESGEAKAVQTLSTKTYLRSLEGFTLGFGKPKTARVAIKNNEVVGCFLYSIDNSGGKKLGYCDLIVVKPEHAGQGVGRALCEDAFSHMWEQGCDYLITFIRDDNVASWAAFNRAGFTNASLPKVAKAVGFAGFLNTYVKHLHGLFVGCDIYFALPPENSEALPKYSKKSGFGQLALHVSINITLILILILGSMGITNLISDPNPFIAQLPSVLFSLLIVFGGVVIFGYIGTLFSRHKWRYRMTSGGLLMCLGFSLFGAFIPMAGNWYPARYENTPSFRRDLGICALLPWIYLIGLLVLSRLFENNSILSAGTLPITVTIILILKCIPIHPISFGSARVFFWNKILWGFMILASLSSVIFL